MGKRLIGSVGLTDTGVPDDLLTTKGDTHGYSSTNARIPIGSDGDVLTADSGEALGLKWATPGGGGQTELVSHNVLGADTASIDVSFTSIGQDDISSLFFIYCGSSVDTSILRMQVNGLTGSLYDSGGIKWVDSTITALASTSASEGILVPWTDREFFAMCWLTIGNSNQTSGRQDIRWTAISQNAQHAGGSSAGAYNTTGQTDFTQIKLFPDSGDLREGSYLDIFRINNS